MDKLNNGVVAFFVTALRQGRDVDECLFSEFPAEFEEAVSTYDEHEHESIGATYHQWI